MDPRTRGDVYLAVDVVENDGLRGLIFRRDCGVGYSSFEEYKKQRGDKSIYLGDKLRRGRHRYILEKMPLFGELGEKEVVGIFVPTTADKKDVLKEIIEGWGPLSKIIE